MKYLLDTHILFWSMSDEKKLSEDVLSVINDPENEIYFSSASVVSGKLFSIISGK